MKAKKKEFLKRRKLKKRGIVQDLVDGELGSDSGEDIEAKVMTDRHKPAFGEQALQPLKVRNNNALLKICVCFLRWAVLLDIKDRGL